MSDGSEWYKKQNKRIGREKGVTQLLAAITGIVGWVNWTPIVFGVAVGLPVIHHIRSRAVNTERKEFAERKLAVTNPFLVFGSLIAVFYLISRATLQIELETSVFVNGVVLFSTLCIGVGLLILIVEHYSNSLYFDWWGNRAFERGHEKNSKFWIWVSGWFSLLSSNSVSDEKLQKERKKKRAQQRQISEPFKPKVSEPSSLSFEFSYVITVLAEMLHWERSLPIILGILVLLVQGFGLLMAVVGSFLLWLGSSFLADHIKYLYHFRPVYDKVFERPKRKTLRGRFLQEVQSYWVANVLSICVVSLVILQ